MIDARARDNRRGLPTGRFRVLRLSDGRIAYEGQMYGGGVARIGPSCLLQVCDIEEDIRVVVSSVRTQCLDRAFFTHFSLDIEMAKIVCVKRTVHFRADFEPIASQILSVAAPGLFPCNLESVIYRKLNRPVARDLAEARSSDADWHHAGHYSTD